MAQFNFDKAKALHASLYVLNRIGKADYHKVFKILYFAEQEHLKKYARPITGDEYQAMQFGPVPSYIYDIFKAVDKKYHPFINPEEFIPYFSVTHYANKPYVEALKKEDTDELSVSDIEALDKSLVENKSLSFKQLVKKSHDEAWKGVAKSEDIEMPYFDIAKAGGASKKMLHYIKIVSENATAKLA